MESKDCSSCVYFSSDFSPGMPGRRSGHSDYYQLSSEVLKQNLILFRSDHSSLEMEK